MYETQNLVKLTHHFYFQQRFPAREDKLELSYLFDLVSFM